MRVFVAGATGAIGKPLVPMLVADGHEVVAMTRSAGKRDALARAKPEVVIHQLTALVGFRGLKHWDRESLEVSQVWPDELVRHLARGIVRVDLPASLRPARSASCLRWSVRSSSATSSATAWRPSWTR